MEATGLIFNIQKFSLHDGPGIRTVVFFKGCPLKCLWCANPESQKARVQILWDPDKCLHCQTCVRACPQGAILHHDGMVSVLSTTCKGCGTCIEACPARALSAEGKTMTVSEVLEICLQDKAFYLESGGGVTLSGGEAMIQPDFAVALLQQLREHHIHTAIETTGYVAPHVFARVAEQLDLLLFDLKHWDENKHMVGTDVSNRLILENLKWAIESGKDVLPRLPVIPGYNDALTDAEGFCERLHQVGSGKVQLLPFHQFGEKKYEMLGRTYAYKGVPALHEEDLTAYRQVFIDHGIDAFF